MNIEDSCRPCPFALLNKMLAVHYCCDVRREKGQRAASVLLEREAPSNPCA